MEMPKAGNMQCTKYVELEFDFDSTYGIIWKTCVILSLKTSEKEGETRWSSKKFRANNSFPHGPKQVNLKCCGDTLRSLAPTPAPTLPPWCAQLSQALPARKQRGVTKSQSCGPRRTSKSLQQHQKDNHGESYIESLWLNWNEAAWTTWKARKGCDIVLQ